MDDPALQGYNHNLGMMLVAQAAVARLLMEGPVDACATGRWLGRPK
jgi:hypothetical protein